MAMIAIKKLHDSPTNPRTIQNAEADAELDASVKVHGVLTALLVRDRDDGHFEVVHGSRRKRAALKAGLVEVPCEVRFLDDNEALELQLVENGQRADVHPLDEAGAFKRLVDEYKYDADAIAARVGKSATHVRKRLQLVHLAADGRKAWLDAKLGEDAAFVLSRVPEALQKKALGDAIQANTPDAWRVKNQGAVFEPVTGPQMRRLVKHGLTLPLAKAPFPIDDATLVPKAGSCATCPKRTGAQPVLFADMAADGDLCTDPNCYREKSAAQFARAAEAAKTEGKKLKVLSAAETKKLFPWAGSEETSYDSPYKKISASERTQLEKAGTPLFLAQHPDGAAVHLARKEDAEKLRRSSAAKSRATSPSSGPSASEKAKQKKNREKVRLEEEADERAEDAVMRAFVASAEKGLDQEERLRALVLSVLSERIDYDEDEAIATRRGLSLEDAATGKAITADEVLRRFIATSKAPALRGLLVELVIASFAYDIRHPDKSAKSELGTLAKAFGVNVAAISSAARKAPKPSTSPATKPAGKAKAKPAAKKPAKRGR